MGTGWERCLLGLGLGRRLLLLPLLLVLLELLLVMLLLVLLLKVLAPRQMVHMQLAVRKRALTRFPELLPLSPSLSLLLLLPLP